MQSVAEIGHGLDGIQSNVACAPFRQVLIASRSVTAECGLRPGDLRENIEVDCGWLYDLPSGTVLKIGQALIRLTFHCEPCKTILKHIEFDRIEHRRGVLGCFLNAGTISVGDTLTISDMKMEPIPYAVHDRILWFLQNHDAKAAVADLVHNIGLPSTAIRLLARILKKRQPEPA